MFEFEKLDVYQLALSFCENIEKFIKELPKSDWAYIDQLKRAALSIPLNIAEGSGRWKDGEKRQFYLISRGSVFECVPILELLVRRGFLTVEMHSSFKETLDRLAGMLTNLSKRFSRDR